MASCAARSLARCTRLRSFAHHYHGPTDRPPGLVLVQCFPGFLHRHSPADNGADLAAGGKLEQVSVDLIGDVATVEIEAEAAHAGVDRGYPGEHDADDVDVADACHPQRPAGHAIVVIVGETHGQVPATASGAPPRPPGEAPAGQVVNHVGARIGRAREHRLDEVLLRVVDHKT